MAATKKKSKGKGSGADGKLVLGEAAQGVFVKAGTVGIILVAASLLLGFTADDSGKQFFHSYLVAYMWLLSIGLGALWWVTLQHLVNARWSIVVRRVGELLAANMTLLAILALPIVVPMLFGNATLYKWVDTELMHADHILHGKMAYLNVAFFAVRFVIYFAFWAALSQYFLKKSTLQDKTGDAKLAKNMAKVSAPSMILLALTLTFAAIDFLMTLDPMWFSTIFGVYYFAGSVIAVHATLALTLMWLQSKGKMGDMVTTEHYHDIGKMMFAFVVFWAYIGFSQFMLIWYANVPEETAWFKERFDGDWKYVSAALLFAHFAIPFFGLLSRHIKRNKKALAFWAVWMLVMHWVDMYWLVMPNISHGHVSFHLLDLMCWVGLACLFVAGAAFQAKSVNLVPTKDHRLGKSLAFENY